MRRYSNLTRRYRSIKQKETKKIDWKKQMIYGNIYPGRIFYQTQDTFIREYEGTRFKKLSKTNMSELMKMVSPGDVILLKDTADQDMVKYINQRFIVKQIDMNGSIFGNFSKGDCINLLPETDIIINLSKGMHEINFVKEEKERILEI